MSIADVERPQRDRATPKLEWGSDAAVQTLRDLDVPYVTLNPGSSIRGFQDSLVNFGGNERPQLLLCLHEEHAVAIAHGYAKVTGEPLGVLLHANVGLMHASMAIFNAYCDRAPMIVLGSNGPLDAARRRPWIDWIHTTADNGVLVRDYVKWDDQPGSPPALVEAIVRGAQLARTAPCGPVFVGMDIPIQEEAIAETLALPDVKRFAPLPDPRPAPRLVSEAAARLVGAERPVMVVGRVTRSSRSWSHRIALAEALDAKVVTDLRAAASFPTDHRLHGGSIGYNGLSRESLTTIARADVVLGLDAIDLSGALAEASGDGDDAKTVIVASVDDYVHRGWSKDHQAPTPADIRLTATPEAAVECLLSELRVNDSEGHRPGTAGGSMGRDASRWDPSAPLSLAALVQRLLDKLATRPVCIAHVPLGWQGTMADFGHPLDFLGYSGGAGLGAGPGITVGAALALAHEERIVVGVVGDGDFSMGMSALWTAARYRLPLLMVVANNRSYYIDEQHQARIAGRRSRLQENRGIGQRMIEPEVDFATLAQAQGLVGLGPVRRTIDLDQALEAAIEAVSRGASVVLDVHVEESPDRPADD